MLPLHDRRWQSHNVTHITFNYMYMPLANACHGKLVSAEYTSTY